jgi:hypothetical protein
MAASERSQGLLRVDSAGSIRQRQRRQSATAVIVPTPINRRFRPTGVTEQIGERRPFEGAIDREQTFTECDLQGRALRQRLLDPLTEDA